MLVEWIRTGKPTSLGAISGALAGLVAITLAGYVEVLPAMLAGFAGGIICYGGVLLKDKFGYDDALDVVGIHGIGGTWGCACHRPVRLRGHQQHQRPVLRQSRTGLDPGVSIVATWGYCYIVSRIILYVVDAVVGLRVTPEEEFTGLI